MLKVLVIAINDFIGEMIVLVRIHYNKDCWKV